MEGRLQEGGLFLIIYAKEVQPENKKPKVEGGIEGKYSKIK